MSNIPRFGRSIALLVVALGATIAGFSQLERGLAKEFEMLGTLECGQPSGQPCPPGDFITLWTLAISGVRQDVIVDVSWIRSQLEQAGNKQDDLLCLLVEEIPAVGYRGLAVIERCEDVVKEDNEEKDERDRERNDDSL